MEVQNMVGFHLIWCLNHKNTLLSRWEGTIKRKYCSPDPLPFYSLLIAHTQNKLLNIRSYRVYGLVMFSFSPFHPGHLLLCCQSPHRQKVETYPLYIPFYFDSGKKERKKTHLTYSWVHLEREATFLTFLLFVTEQDLREDYEWQILWCEVLISLECPLLSLLSVWIFSLWRWHWYFPKGVPRSGDVGFDIFPNQIIREE